MGCTILKALFWMRSIRSDMKLGDLGARVESNILKQDELKRVTLSGGCWQE